MITNIIQILAGIWDSIGFALIFGLKRDKLPFIIIGAGLGWAIYLLCFHYTEDVFLSNIAASAFCAASAEFLARWRKAPSTLFLLIHIIPLVPGGSLYYTMRSFVIKDQQAFTSHGLNTLYSSAGIAVGILLITSCIYILNSFKKEEETKPLL